MYIRLKKVALLGVLIGLLCLTAGIIYMHRLSVYTASLATRPFNAGLVGTLNTVEPARLSNHCEQLVSSTMYEGLLYYDEKSGEMKPGIASKWKYSADAKTLTLNLRKDVKFHNGKKLSAQDVKTSWDKNLANTAEWSNISMFLPIAGTAARLEGKANDIYGIEVVNENTIKISLEKPSASFIYALSNPVFWIMDNDAKTDPLPGTGPFILKENKDNKNLLLLRYEDYFRGLPRLTAINFTVFNDSYQALGAYQAGNLDYLDSVPLPEIKNIMKNPQYKQLFIDKPLLETYSLSFNLNKSPFAGNYLLRRALNYGIDRDKIIEEVLGGAYISAKGVIPCGLKAYSKEMRGYTYNSEKAAELLDEAGYPMGQGLKPLLLTYNRGEGHQLVAESVAQQLGELGIEVQVQPLEWDYYKNQIPRMNMSFFRLGWRADYPDSDSFLYSMFHSSRIGISNFSGYNNPQVDKILDSSRAENRSEDERNKLLQRAEEVIVDDAPCLWLFQKKACKMVGKDVNSLNLNNMEMIDWHQVELFKPGMNGEVASSKKSKV